MVTSGCREVTDPVELGFGCAGPDLVVELLSEVEDRVVQDPLAAGREDVTHLCLKMRGARDGVREGRKIKKGNRCHRKVYN